MRWPWRRRQPVVLDPEPAREATEALREAEASLAQAKARQPHVDRVVASHRQMQWENHLGQRVHQELTRKGQQ